MAHQANKYFNDIRHVDVAYTKVLNVCAHSWARFAPLQPVLDVVAVQESVVGAAGEGATVVAQEEGVANGRRNGAGAPAGEPLTRRAPRVDLSPLRGAR